MVIERKYGFGRLPSPPDPRDFLLSKYISLRSRLMARFRKAPVLWECDTVLNQLDTPHCVGFSMAGFGNCLPVDDNFGDDDGHHFYYDCKIEDGEPGAENGSCIRSAAKVLQDHGRIGAYAFARTVGEIKIWLLENGPVVVGTEWTTAMMEPGASGFVRVLGGVVGGHAWLLIGYDPRGDFFTALNSWGSEWGQIGRFKITADDFAFLFARNGEALTAVEMPLNGPEDVKQYGRDVRRMLQLVTV